MNTPPSKRHYNSSSYSSPIKRSLPTTPMNVSSPNVSSPNVSSPIKRSSRIKTITNNTISMNNGEYSLDPNFKEYLLGRIPIFKDENLYSLIIEYCLALNSNSQRKIITSKDKITKYLHEIKVKCIENMEKMRNMMVNEINKQYKIRSKKKDATNDESFNFFIKNQKYIKSHTITSEALIEALINCILYYCSDGKSTINSSLYYSKSNNNILYQTMNIAQEMSLGDFIKSLYESSLDIVEKNTYLLKVLKDIARNLLFLQNNCGFIHGDLHSGNIFLKFHPTNDTQPIEITFIDFGYSSIKMPLNNGKTLIITTPNESIINEKQYKLILPYDIQSKEYLKGIDMYHLMITLSEPDDNPFTECRTFINKLLKLFENGNVEIYNILNRENLISLNINGNNRQKIVQQIKIKKRNVSSNRHLFTASKFFELNQRLPKYQIFLPEIFKNINEKVVQNNTKTSKKEKRSGGLFDN